MSSRVGPGEWKFIHFHESCVLDGHRDAGKVSGFQSLKAYVVHPSPTLADAGLVKDSSHRGRVVKSH
jgi:hypothetical protein